jgi:hypothetical protein
MGTPPSLCSNCFGECCREDRRTHDGRASSPPSFPWKRRTTTGTRTKNADQGRENAGNGGEIAGNESENAGNGSENAGNDSKFSSVARMHVDNVSVHADVRKKIASLVSVFSSVACDLASVASDHSSLAGAFASVTGDRSSIASALASGVGVQVEDRQSCLSSDSQFDPGLAGLPVLHLPGPSTCRQELVLVVVCESGDLLGLLLPKAARDL